MDEKNFIERRHPVLCVNCGTPMVTMNRYTVLKDTKKICVWYVCPRRKKEGEGGCGHKSIAELKNESF